MNDKPQNTQLTWSNYSRGWRQQAFGIYPVVDCSPNLHIY